MLDSGLRSYAPSLCWPSTNPVRYVILGSCFKEDFLGLLHGSVGRASHFWPQLRSWSQGCEFKPHVPHWMWTLLCNSEDFSRDTPFEKHYDPTGTFRWEPEGWTWAIFLLLRSLDRFPETCEWVLLELILGSWSSERMVSLVVWGWRRKFRHLASDFSFSFSSWFFCKWPFYGSWSHHPLQRSIPCEIFLGNRPKTHLDSGTWKLLSTPILLQFWDFPGAPWAHTHTNI